MLEFNIEWLVDLCSSIVNGRGLSGLRNSNIKAELIIPLVWLYMTFITEKVTLLCGADLRFNSSLNSAAVAAQSWSYGGWLLLNAVTEAQSSVTMSTKHAGVFISFWNSALLCHTRGERKKKGVRLSTSSWNVDMNGNDMSAKVIRVVLTEILLPNQTKSYNICKTKPTLGWLVILFRPQKPSLHVQEWGIPPQWP